MNLDGGQNNQNNQNIVRVNLPKPYKLDHNNLSLDKLEGWITILKAFAGSDPRYIKFMEGGANERWTPADEDATRGLVVQAVLPQNPNEQQQQDAEDLALARTLRLRSECQEFLSLIGSYTPEGLFRPTVQESSSLRWIIDTIKTTFNLQTRGENLVLGQNMTFDKSRETYQQFYMRLRSFHMESLLPAGTNFKGRALQAQETMSPLAETLIVNMWLTKMDPRLPNHVKATKSFLFTAEKPTLACVQPQLAVMMETMMAELDNDSVAGRISMDSSTNPLLAVNRLSSTTSGYNRPFNQPRNYGNSPYRGRGFNNSRQPRSSAQRGGSTQFSSRRNKLCMKCYEAGREETVYSSHDTNNCYSGTSGARVRYITIPVEEWQDQGEQQQLDQDYQQQEFQEEYMYQQDFTQQI